MLLLFSLPHPPPPPNTSKVALDDALVVALPHRAIAWGWCLVPDPVTDMMPALCSIVPLQQNEEGINELLDRLVETAKKSILTHTRAKDEEALTRIVSKNISTANRVILKANSLHGGCNFLVSHPACFFWNLPPRVHLISGRSISSPMIHLR